MRRRAALALAALMLALAGCPSAPPVSNKPPPPDKGFPVPGDVRDSVYQALDRTTPTPPGYGLYTVLLARTADRATVRVLGELLASTSIAADAALARENLNLIVLPVRNAAEANRTLAAARSQPEPTALALMQKSYDFGRAVQWMASVCRPANGAEVMKACGSALPDGPLLVTALRLPDGSPAPQQGLLVVNLAKTQPEALRTVLDAYRQQIQRKDYAGPGELTGWRLWTLNRLLEAAQILPGISKAYAAGK